MSECRAEESEQVKWLKKELEEAHAKLSDQVARQYSTVKKNEEV